MGAVGALLGLRPFLLSGRFNGASAVDSVGTLVGNLVLGTRGYWRFF